MSGAKSTNGGFTLIELLIVAAVIGIIAAIAVPGLLHARMVSNEAAAISSLRSIYSAQVNYSSACGGGGYATTLTVLAVPPPGGTQPFLSPDMTTGATVQKSGFSTTMTNGGFGAGSNDCNGTATALGFYASTVPLNFGSSGSRSFATDAAGTIFFTNAAAAPNPASTGIPLE